MLVDRAWIESRIPHQGRMCLLDEVLDWDLEHIISRSASHRSPDHPLRAHGRLGAACGIEYAAQTMAVHGALLMQDSKDGRPVAGFLVGVRGVRLYVPRLDDVREDLICDAGRVVGDEGTALYEFVLRSAAATLISGRATVVFDAAASLNR